MKMGQNLTTEPNRDYTPSSSLQFPAILGDAQHRIDVYLACNRFDAPVVDSYLTGLAQSNWLRTHRPDLVPGRDPSGNLPSIARLSTIFEANYWSCVSFRSQYLRWLYEQDVRRYFATGD